MEKKTLGTFLAVLRKASGMTQKQLADQLNVSDKAVSRWERDESAPDLTLIPVIAEIFGITSDELLRGERATSQMNPVRAAEKTDNQVRRILKDTLTKYKIRSCISVCVALFGLIVAIILNLGFLRAYLGFFLGCIFFTAACLFQIIFLFLGHGAVDPEEVDEAATAPIRKAMTCGAEIVFGFIWIVFSACLPLVLLPGSPFVGLTAKTWVEYSLLFVPLALIMVLMIATLINLKLGYWRKPNMKAPGNLLRLRWMRKGAAALLICILIHATTVSLMVQNYHLFVDAQKFDNWDDFRRYMEKPTDTDGNPLTFERLETESGTIIYYYQNHNGETVTFSKDQISEQLYATLEDEEAGNKPLVRYRHLNRNVHSIRLNKGGLPVQTFTQTQIQTVESITFLLHGLWVIVYLVIIGNAIRKYRKDKESL